MSWAYYKQSKTHLNGLFPTMRSLSSKTNIQRLLQEMNVMALNIIEVNGRPVEDFNIGFHADPSMQQLHLHVISTDFNSTSLKTKKHWNSFNTEFFIPFKKLVDQLTAGSGKISKLSESVKKELLATPLKCNKCSFKPKNIPDLKIHLMKHN